MATVTFDGPNKIITIGYDASITTIDVIDIYSRWKEWVISNSQFEPAFDSSIGGNPLGGGSFLGQYFFLNNDIGWRIIPTDQEHQLEISGELYATDTNQPLFSQPANANVTIVLQRSTSASGVNTGDGGIDYDRIKEDVIKGVVPHIWSASN